MCRCRLIVCLIVALSLASVSVSSEPAAERTPTAKGDGDERDGDESDGEVGDGGDGEVTEDEDRDADSGADSKTAEAAGEDEQPRENEGATTDTARELPDLPENPEARLVMAEEAFREADYGLLRPLLEPVVTGNQRLQTPTKRNEARLLLGVGYFFDAQQVPDQAKRRDLLDLARAQFLALLREAPDYEIDTLIYPASVVELFEDVRSKHSEELEELRAERAGEETGRTELQPIYFERSVEQNYYALNFFPFGIGQFQNGSPVKGTLFAVGQWIALGLNLTSFAVIDGLRGSNGFYDVDDGSYSDALVWRQVQYWSLGAFASLWLISGIDSVLNFEPTTVHIRSLDAPPPELETGGGEAGKNFSLPLGLAVELDW